MVKLDQELIANYFNGDPESLEILVKRYLPAVYGRALRLAGNRQDAEDISQEVFLRVWRNLRKFDTERSFRAWILSITRNACIDFLRKKKEIPFTEFENAEGVNLLIEKIADPSLSPLEEFERKNFAAVLARASWHLSVKYRKVFSLRAADFTFLEIAEKLGEPFNTVKSRYRRAILMLKKILGDTLLR